MRLARYVGAGLGAVVLLAACSSSPQPAPSTSTGPQPAAISVVAAFYPLAYAAGQVGGSAASVTDLTPPGVEPHDLELTPQQVAEIAAADLVVYVPGFQPAVDEAVAQGAADRALDVSALVPLIPAGEEGDPHGHDDGAEPHGSESATDPHVWLNPLNMKVIAAAIAERLAELAPEQAAELRSAADVFGGGMDSLDGEWRSGTRDCANRDLVVSHEAFGYLAQRYSFEQVGVSGLSPDTEPSPAKIAEISQFVRDNDVTTIYYETLADPKVAQTIADETGASTAVLDPIEGIPAGSTDDYVTLMLANLDSVRTGQGCS